MVRCWLLASMEVGISETFVYVDSATQLWEELVERFGQVNGPLLYQLKRNLASLEQGNLTIGEYYSKMKKVWDEIQSLEPFPECECGYVSRFACSFMKKILEQDSRNKLI